MLEGAKPHDRLQPGSFGTNCLQNLCRTQMMHLGKKIRQTPLRKPRDDITTGFVKKDQRGNVRAGSLDLEPPTKAQHRTLPSSRRDTNIGAIIRRDRRNALKTEGIVEGSEREAANLVTAYGCGAFATTDDFRSPPLPGLHQPPFAQ